MSAVRTLTFTGVGVADESIDFTGSGVIETFKTSRLANKQVAIQNDTATQVKAFYDAFVTDHNAFGAYNVEFDSTTFTVEHPDDTHFDGLTNTMSNITIASSTRTPTPVFSLDSEVYAENSVDKCEKVLMTLTFSEEFGGTVEGIELTRLTTGSPTTLFTDAAHNSNTFQFALDRESYKYTKVKVNIGNEEKSFTLTAPKNKLEITNVEVGTAPYSQNVTIFINEFIGSSETQFALPTFGDSPTYQSSNIFTGVTPGQYNAYAKDKYGCVKSQSIEVGELEVNTDGSFFMSIKNSHYFAKRPLGNYMSANVENFLSYDDPYPEKVKNFSQVWASNQILTDQFMSSLARFEVTLKVLCETDDLGQAIEYDLPVTKRTDNITKDTFLQGKIETDSATNNMRISFVPGDIYDENGTVIGQHTFDEVLPSYYEPGIPVIVDGQHGQIINTFTESSIEYALTNISYVGGNSTTTTIHSIHQDRDFDVFEFKTTHTDLVGSKYQIEIKGFANGTTTTPSVCMLSEVSKVISFDDFRELNYHRVRFWSNESDAEINYTNWEPAQQKLSDDDDVPRNFIVHERNIPFDFPLRPLSSAEIEALKLDDQFVKIDFTTNSMWNTFFKKQPALFAGSTAKLFDESDYMEVDGIVFTTSTAAEIEDAAQHSYVRPKLIKSGGSNEIAQITNTIESFYPVKVN